MLKKTGTLGGRFCTVFAACVCALILLQNLSGVLKGQPAVTLVGLLVGCLLVLLCRQYLHPSRRFATMLFFLRFGLALLFIVWLDTRPVQDFATMYHAAQQLAAGNHAYLGKAYFFNWAYQSGFVAYEALVISLFGSGLFPLQLLNALFMAGTNVLVYRLARRFASDEAAMTVGLLYCLYPAPLFLAGVLTNQHLSVFLLYLALYLLLSKEVTVLRALAAGAVMALGNAMRPIGVIVLLAAALWLLLKAAQKNSLHIAGHALCIAAAYFAVGAILSAFIVSSGINPQGLSNNQPMWKFVVGLNQSSNGSWNQADYDAFLSLPTQQAHEAMTEAVKDRLSVGPARLAALALRKSKTMWAGSEDLFWGFGHLDKNASAIPGFTWNQMQLLLGHLDKGIYLLAFTLALVGILLRLRDKERCGPTLPLILLVCGYYTVHLIVEVQSRYRYFLMPCIFILAALALPKRKKK